MLLAASRDVSQDILYLTMVVPSLIPTMTEHSPDVAVPSRLLARLGLEHTIFHCSPRMEDNALAQLCRQNVAAAHEAWGAIATSLFARYPQGRVLVYGNCSEIFRAKQYRNLDLNRTSGRTMANFFGWGLARNALVHRSIGEWLENAKAACQKTGFDILVLQHWEQKTGRWAAQWTLEHDLVHEVFMPFNCRELLITALSVDWKLRSAISDFRLARRIAEILWPEVLSEPVNPASSWFERIKRKARAKMRVRGYPRGYPASLTQKVIRHIDPYRY